MNSLLQEMGIAAKAAANSLRKASTKQKNEGLLAMEAALYASRCYPDCKREGHRSCRGQWFADADDRTLDFEPATDQRDGG